MKKAIIAMLLSTSVGGIASAQPSVSIGLISRFQGVAKVAVEKKLGWSSSEIGAVISIDNTHPIIGFQTGYTTQGDYDDTKYRIAVGAFYHTGILPVDKDTREKQLRFGGSFRFEINKCIIGFEYNGETLAITMGFTLKKRN